jgi:hypothetical protein
MGCRSGSWRLARRALPDDALHPGECRPDGQTLHTSGKARPTSRQKPELALHLFCALKSTASSGSNRIVWSSTNVQIPRSPRKFSGCGQENCIFVTGIRVYRHSITGYWRFELCWRLIRDQTTLFSHKHGSPGVRLAHSHGFGCLFGSCQTSIDIPTERQVRPRIAKISGQNAPPGHIRTQGQLR